MRMSAQLPGTKHLLQKPDIKLLQVPGGNASDGTEMCMQEAQVSGSSFAASQAQQTEIKSRPGKEGLLLDSCLCLFPPTPIPK